MRALILTVMMTGTLAATIAFAANERSYASRDAALLLVVTR